MLTYLRDMARVLNTPCREHTKVMSRTLDGGAPPGAAAGLRLHLLLCARCRHFLAQLRFLKAAAGRLPTETADRVEAAARMPAEVRERVRERLRRAG